MKKYLDCMVDKEELPIYISSFESLMPLVILRCHEETKYLFQCLKTSLYEEIFGYVEDEEHLPI